MERETLCGALCAGYRVWQELDGQARARRLEDREAVEKALQWAVGAHDVLAELDATAAPTPEQELELARRVNALVDCD